MQIDIRTLLRKLLCAGVPLLGAGCSGEAMNGLGGSPPGQSLENTPPGQSLVGGRCTERLLVPATAGAPAAKEKAALVITADDDRWGDFYQACVARQHHCAEVCVMALNAGLPPKPGFENRMTTCALSECTEQGRPVLYVTYNVSAVHGVPGRRPAGFDCPALPEGDVCGAWLARAAALEAASIPAFAQMARELEAHGAPAALVARARAAMADEARHFRITRQLARAYGSEVERPRPAPVAVRSVVDMAIENIAEGCVNETFAALLALWQSTHASDERVRMAMAGIAEDEIRHAQLSWDVADFLMPRLRAAEARAVAATFVEATGALALAATSAVDPALVAQLGLPDGPATAELAAGLRASLPPHAGRPAPSLAAHA
jgi:hypothetical protein